MQFLGEKRYETVICSTARGAHRCTRRRARAQAPAQSLTGLWDAAVVVNGLEIPFRFEIAGNGAQVSGWFFNGDEKVTSTGGKFENGSLVLNFDHYATSVEADARERTPRRHLQPRHRVLSVLREALRAAGGVSRTKCRQIDGLWQIGGVKSNKGESAWRFIVRQSGAEVTAAILRVDGDTGALAGTYRNGKFIV